MCKNHSGVLVAIPTASVTFSDQTPRPNGNKRGIDACIAPIVKALNDAGVGTVASCCGHGTHVGSVALSDGRELLVVPDFETARRFDGPLDAEPPKEDGEFGGASRRLLKLVVEQAEDEGLWFVALTASEAYLQQELRRLHALIEEGTE